MKHTDGCEGWLRPYKILFYCSSVWKNQNLNSKKSGKRQEVL